MQHTTYTGAHAHTDSAYQRRQNAQKESEKSRWSVFVPEHFYLFSCNFIFISFSIVFSLIFIYGQLKFKTMHRKNTDDRYITLAILRIFFSNFIYCLSLDYNIYTRIFKEHIECMAHGHSRHTHTHRDRHTCKLHM